MFHVEKFVAVKVYIYQPHCFHLFSRPEKTPPITKSPRPKDEALSFQMHDATEATEQVHHFDPTQGNAGKTAHHPAPEGFSCPEAIEDDYAKWHKLNQ